MVQVLRSLYNVALQANDFIAKVDKDPLRKTINLVSFFVLSFFAQRNYENTMWWGFSFMGGVIFNRQIRAGLLEDIGGMSIKFLAPIMFLSTAYYWHVNWKVISVFTGLAAGVMAVDAGTWCNRYAVAKDSQKKTQGT